MPKEQYKFNPDTLEYEKSGRSKRTRIISYIFTSMALGFIIAFMLYISTSYISTTNSNRKIKEDIKIMEAHYKELLERKKQADQYLSELKERDRRIYMAIFESEPEQDSSENVNLYQKLEDDNIIPYAEKNMNKLKKLRYDAGKLEKEINLLQEIIKKKSKKITNIPGIQPVENGNLELHVCGFGKRIDPFYGKAVFHPGLDYVAAEGTDVVATADGKIISAGTRERGKGKKIIIDHGNGYKTSYAHLRAINVNIGQNVKRGQKIGEVGNTGKSFTSHVHYEVLYNDEQIDPVNYFFMDLDPSQYFQIYLYANKVGQSLD